MKKTQKRLGNKGFSLVELIVVIAIMAVLVGVLAPTLIKNVEKSRKAKDEQNLDTVKEAIVVALQDDAENGVYENLTTNGTDAIVIAGTSGEVTFGSAVSTASINAVAENLSTKYDASTKKLASVIKLTSKDYKSKTVKYTVSSAGAVTYKAE